jgi:hypothetical protein
MWKVVGGWGSNQVGVEFIYFGIVSIPGLGEEVVKCEKKE